MNLPDPRGGRGELPPLPPPPQCSPDLPTIHTHTHTSITCVWYTKCHKIVLNKLTVDFLEHGGHILEVVMIEEPDAGITLILLKWYWRK